MAGCARVGDVEYAGVLLLPRAAPGGPNGIWSTGDLSSVLLCVGSACCNHGLKPW